jgi:hypothetical protein
MLSGTLRDEDKIKAAKGLSMKGVIITVLYIG